MIDILIPSLNRPQRLPALIANLHATTKFPHKLHFAISDVESARILQLAGENYVMDCGEPPESTFGNRCNRLYLLGNMPFVYTVGDDDEHLDGWDTYMLAKFVPGIELVISKCNHMTMMTRNYIETQSGCVDIPNVIYGPYAHNYTELELCCTAKMRGVAAWCNVPTVIHHRHVGNGDCCVGDFEHDDTYKRGDDTFAEDERLFQQREAAYFSGNRYW